MRPISARVILLLSVSACCLSGCGGKPAQPAAPAVQAATPVSTKPPVRPTSHSGWLEDFQIPKRKLESTGVSRYFILLPGYRQVLSDATGTLTITVTNNTKEFNGITARAVEEREAVGTETVELTLDYYAIDPATGDAFYFGEEVTAYRNGQPAGHPGAWLAYENDNRPGLIMPGSPLVGMKYYQELAPGVAKDRAKVISVSESVSTSAGDFTDCLLTQESSGVEAGVVEYKTYCPGVGLVQDESYVLTNYIPVANTNP